MEACRVERTQQAFKFQAAHAWRTQRPDRVEKHIPAPGTAAFQGFQVREADGLQLEKNHHIIVRFFQFSALSERLGDAFRKCCVACRKRS